MSNLIRAGVSIEEGEIVSNWFYYKFANPLSGKNINKIGKAIGRKIFKRQDENNKLEI